MGNSLSSTRQPKRVSSPRKVKNPNRFSFGSRKKRALQQQQAAAAVSPRKRFGFGTKKKAHRQPKVVATKPKRFGFGRKKAHHQPYEATSTPAAIQNIKAKISPSPAAPVGTSKRAKKDKTTSLAKRLGPLAFAKAKQRKQAPPPTAKRGFLSGLTSSRNRRRY